MIMDHLQPAAAPPAVAADSAIAAGPDRRSSAAEKRKRGRPPRGQALAKPPPLRKMMEEEDVCFICFDGGSLVLCDRKGCPKAYHPACIKRDDSYFSSTAKWNCGWHICSVCQKSSHYLCYTCTFSLCKVCTASTDYFSVRGNKGFCSTCMKTIMLIENKDEVIKEKGDFLIGSALAHIYEIPNHYLLYSMPRRVELLPYLASPVKLLQGICG